MVSMVQGERENEHTVTVNIPNHVYKYYERMVDDLNAKFNKINISMTDIVVECMVAGMSERSEQNSWEGKVKNPADGSSQQNRSVR